MNKEDRSIMTENFENMMKLAEFGANSHRERRQVIFRIFISYMTLLVVTSGLIMNNLKDEEQFIEEDLFVWGVSVVLSLMLSTYWLWLRRFYEASDFDVRRRDFYLTKAEVVSYHLSKKLDLKEYSSCDEILLNIGGNKGYLISEKNLFKKKRPDVQTTTNSKICWKCPPLPTVWNNWHFLFHIVAPAGGQF